MIMKRYVAIALFAFVAVAFACTSGAQESADTTVATIVDRINASGTIEVHQPAALDARLRKTAETDNGSTAEAQERTAAQGRVGYRIQVFDDNDPRTARSEAQNRKRMMESRFPEWHVYLQFNSPYWRVKVGDFRSRSEAEGAIEDMRRAFPYMSSQLRIVRDRINSAD